MRGARCTMAWVMPVSTVISGGIARPGFTIVWNVPRTSPPRTFTAPTSVIAQSAGEEPRQEIMDLARKIGTYETSILPYEDCCVLFSPKHPLTRPDKAIATEHYNAMGIEPFIEEALSNLEVFHFDERGKIIEKNHPTPDPLF